MRNIYEVNYMDDKNIDERIKNICLQAENNYILNYTKSTPQDDEKNKNLSSDKIKLNLNPNDEMSSFLDKTMTYSKEQNDNKNLYENEQNDIFNNYNLNNNENNLNNNGYDLDTNDYISNNNEYNLNNNEFNLHNNNYSQNNNKYNQSNNKYNSSSYKQNNNIRNEVINKRILHSRNNNNFQINKNSNISQELVNSMNNKIKYISNNMISPNKFNAKYSNIQEEEDIVNYNSQLILSQSEIKNHNHNHNNTNFFSASSSFCFECDLHKLINDKNIYNKDLNIKAQQNKEINKIILKAKTLLVKNKLKKAYDLLSIYINSNIKNPDLYYLYGEACRKLKYMENAEKYLLECMNFKNCSPYVYLSLAELYKEIGQFKYSKQFYKKCLIYFNKGNIYYNLAINYMKLNKPIKALNFITEAIDMDKNIPSYYKLRSDIYKNLGHKDLSEKDLYQYNIILNK